MEYREGRKYWRLLIDPPLDGATNMAIDETLLESCSSGERTGLFPTLRLYRWKKATISIGYNQKLENSVDLRFCRKNGLDVVRRQTGGKVVLHDRELTYSIIAPFSIFPFTDSVAENYRIISGGIVEGLRLVGVDTRIASDEIPSYDPFSSGHCFSGLSRFEISYRGMKMVGSAQRRRKKAFLQHGSIPLEMNRELLAAASRPEGVVQADDIPSGAEELSFITVGEAAGREVSFGELSAALEEGFKRRWGILFGRAALTEEEKQLADELKSKKYQTLQ